MKSFNPALSLAGSIALAGGVLTFSAPAMAGSLSWSNGISPAFFNLINTVNATDTFTVNFDPAGVNFVTASDVPPFVNGITPATPVAANHQTTFFRDTACAVALEAVCTYTNTTPLVWDWTNGASVGVAAGNTFQIIVDAESADIVLNTPILPGSAIFTGFAEGITPVPGTAGFTANSASEATSYSAQIQTIRTTVPGPLPILGAGIAFGYSRKLRRRIIKKSATV